MTAIQPQSRPLAPPPRVRLWSRHFLSAAIVTAALAAVFLLAWRATEMSGSTLVAGWHGMVDFFEQAWPPDLNWGEVVQPALDAAKITLYIAFLGTVLSIPPALIFAVLGARTTTPNAVVYQVARSILSFLRAVPEVVFALVLRNPR